jgi:hypothetical protein
MEAALPEEAEPPPGRHPAQKDRVRALLSETTHPTSRLPPTHRTSLALSRIMSSGLVNSAAHLPLPAEPPSSSTPARAAAAADDRPLGWTDLRTQSFTQNAARRLPLRPTTRPRARTRSVERCCTYSVSPVVWEVADSVACPALRRSPVDRRSPASRRTSSAPRRPRKSSSSSTTSLASLLRPSRALTCSPRTRVSRSGSATSSRASSPMAASSPRLARTRSASSDLASLHRPS